MQKLGLILIATILGSCATAPRVVSKPSSSRTVVFFLIDGLSIATLTEQMTQNRAPAIKNYFSGSNSHFSYAHTSFPSMTFPAIGSLLTEKPISTNGIFGNRIINEKNQIIDFESPSHFIDYNKMIEGKNVFARLQQKNETAVSFAYAINADTIPVIASKNLGAGLAILNRSYEAVDDELIDGLQKLLTAKKPEDWPHFIFIHLIGVDFTAHEQGSHSKDVAIYLKNLDQKLAPIFQTLLNAEKSKQRQIISMLSADHGFDETHKRTVLFDELILKKNPEIRVLNEGRYAGLYFPKNLDSEQRLSILKSFLKNTNIDLIALRDQKNIFVQSAKQEVMMMTLPATCADGNFALSIIQQKGELTQPNASPWTCPENITGRLSQIFYPYFLSNLSYYFHAEQAPDAIVVARSGVSLKLGYEALHGGPTARETLIPLLLRNSQVESDRIPAIWELLRFL